MAHTNHKFKIFLNTSLVLVSTLLDKSAFFIINIFIARYLTKELFGEYSTALNYATFFSVLISVGINQTLVRSVNLEQHLEKEHFGNALFVKTVLAVIAYAAMIISLIIIFLTSDKYSLNTIYLILILGVVRFANEYLSVFFAFYDSKEKFALTSLFNFIFSIMLLTGTLTVIFLNGTYFHIALIRLFVVLLILISVIFCTLRNFKISFNKQYIRGFVIQSIPFAAHGILGNLRQRLSIIILSLITGTTSTGIYNNAFIFLQSLSVLPFNINRVLIPYLYKISYEDNRNKFQFTYDIFSKIFAISSVYFFLTFYLYAEPLITYFFSSKYEQSIPVLRILSFGIPFMFNFSITILIVLDKQIINTWINGISTIVNIACSVPLIIFFGVEGNAIALVITFFVSFILGIGYLWHTKTIMIKKSLYIYLKLIVISLFCIMLERICLRKMFFLTSAIIVSMSYGMLILLFFVRNEDFRIIKETFFTNKKTLPSKEQLF
ncbi:MAG: flippase [Spirochaetes bacterium]|jgi:O-antigen/teichoic acid export membrane protein|nr:flippase [Spirochaetota bacterium]